MIVVQVMGERGRGGGEKEGRGGREGRGGEREEEGRGG